MGRGSWKPLVLPDLSSTNTARHALETLAGFFVPSKIQLTKRKYAYTYPCAIQKARIYWETNLSINNRPASDACFPRLKERKTTNS